MSLKFYLFGIVCIGCTITGVVGNYYYPWESVLSMWAVLAIIGMYDVVTDRIAYQRRYGRGARGKDH